MKTIKKIKKAQLAARKARDKAAAVPLTTLLGELDTMSKKKPFDSDDEVVAVVSKFIDRIAETIQILLDADKDASTHIAEKELLEQFLPQQLTDDYLKHAIISAINVVSATSMKDMGKVMKQMKADYPNQFDGKVASEMVKEMLK